MEGLSGGGGRAGMGKMGGMTENERIWENGRMWRRVEVEEGIGEGRSREEEEGRRGREYGLKRGKKRRGSRDTGREGD